MFVADTDLGKLHQRCIYVLLVLGVLLEILVFFWFGVVSTSYTVNETTSEITKNKLAGFTFNWKSASYFNWHPILMTIAFVVLHGCAISAFRIQVTANNLSNKGIHIACHILTFVFAVLGALAAITYHHEFKIPHYYTLHSWLGILLFSLFVLNFAFGAASFWCGGYRSELWRKPVHACLGYGIFLTSIVVMTLGISQKVFFNKSCNLTGYEIRNDKPKVYENAQTFDCILGNSIGVLLVMYGLLMAFTLTISHFLPQSIVQKFSSSIEQAPLLPPTRD